MAALDFNTILENIRGLVIFPVFTGLVIIMFLYAGILFVTSDGEPGKITKARQAVIWAFVGTLVGILAYSATGWIKTILGIS